MLLLFQYAIFLAILLLLEMTAGILGFIFKDWVRIYYDFFFILIMYVHFKFNFALSNTLSATHYNDFLLILTDVAQCSLQFILFSNCR